MLIVATARKKPNLVNRPDAYPKPPATTPGPLALHEETARTPDPLPPLSLTRQLELRDLALTHIEQGVGVFDSQQRLLLANRRFAEIYRLSPGQLHLGMTLRDIIDLRYAAGTGPDMPPEQYAAWRSRINISDRVLDTEVTLGDGRILAIHHEPTKGGGWVATHDDITDRRRAEAHIRHMAHHDELTGLPNRVRFTTQLDRTLARLRSQDLADPRPQPSAPTPADAPDFVSWNLAVLFIDLDHFKDVNDTLGHAAGDDLLRLLGPRIAQALPPNALLARLGGDEFAVLLENTAGARDDIVTIANHIIDAISSPFQLGDVAARVGASLGIATCAATDTDLTPALLLRQADMALYRVKAEGRGAMQFFDPAMFEALKRRTSLERDLRQALADNQIEVHYQPLIDPHSGHLAGVEALARWDHPEHGPVSPAEFIPAAEAAGMIGILGERVLRTACTHAAAWGIRLAVNLSPEQVRRADIIDTVRNVLADTGFPPSLLELEITETLLLHDTTPTLEKLKQLRALGIGIALDDFGTGYSSLSYLDRFPFTKLKIDRSFIGSLTGDPGAAAIIQAVVTLGRTLALRVNAEGVETPEQLEQLRNMGCDEVQGFHLGRPIPAHQLAANHNLPVGTG